MGTQRDAHFHYGRRFVEAADVDPKVKYLIEDQAMVGEGRGPQETSRCPPLIFEENALWNKQVKVD